MSVGAIERFGCGWRSVSIAEGREPRSLSPGAMVRVSDGDVMECMQVEDFDRAVNDPGAPHGLWVKRHVVPLLREMGRMLT